MIDIYMNGAEVHAETPEEEREASLILSAALSGKKIPAGGCICPDQRDSTVGKGITMRFCDGTDMTITPTSDAEGNPELEICKALDNKNVMKKENSMQTFYDDTLKHLDPFATLSAGLEGKYLCYGGGVKPLQRGKSFAEGFIMRLADRPDNPENTIISVEPWLNKDGAPQLKMTVYQAAGSVQRAQANEQAVEWAVRLEAVLC